MTGCERILARLERGPATAAEPMAFAETPDEHRFLSKVAVKGKCWTWTGATTKKGYGHFRLDGRTQIAHRVMHDWFYGPEWAVGLDVDHLCRNRACVNPMHLEAVTHAENVRRGETGQYPHGHRTHCDHGHPFDDENTGWRTGSGGRFCRACRREATDRWRDRNRELVRERNREAKRRIHAPHLLGLPSQRPNYRKDAKP